MILAFCGCCLVGGVLFHLCVRGIREHLLAIPVALGVCVGLRVGLAVVLLCLALFLSRRFNSDRQKKSPYECGFDSVGGAREPFSLRFFLLAILFLIFEAEAALFWTVVGGYGAGYCGERVLWGSVALLGLLVGLLWEWRVGCLEWAKD